MPDGSEVMGEEVVVSKDPTEGVGEAMAQRLIEKGALELLQRAEAMANSVAVTLEKTIDLLQSNGELRVIDTPLDMLRYPI